MSQERVFSLRNPWFTVSLGGTIAIAVVAILIGFIWLPSANRGFSERGLWATICSAAGAPSSWYGGANIAGPAPSEVVVLPPLRWVRADANSIGRGATIATQNCSMCHGVLGTVQVTAPALAGQYADVVYKELRDYQNGVRQNAVMQPIIAARSDQDLHDLAAYYASLSRAPAAEVLPAGVGPDANAVKLAMQGDPQRNIAPCAACHGQLDRKGAAPWLGGQSSIYLAAQMRAFAAGARHNDINEQMRNVARQMTSAEIDSVAKYYAAMQ
ncbi:MULTISPECIES: c-type cytochrome [Paraburkholderia]|jgi:Cytochrome c553|uniref:Cytochrome c domain-containing protein n=2 Tax=Paraburkholderia TaxID=1822464 RepID=A0ABN7NA94_9BURK|nr:MULTISPECIES: c-type cytochrome [Paraburkholderia]MBK5150208.1 c-type cytochrome [Burkholderia sp. R-69608]MBK3739248.1 c-type cytochrome [Paraburkholderia aspalathi]MBK3811682.1 c-type cytochrome [Paraburkholderia aspalathi]MBK3823975.1 c-type cytochrome [Paraburkholderia aspalathi]MBK3835816.1 c-type cytochrome [Paraburkholderia aspalathi]